MAHRRKVKYRRMSGTCGTIGATDWCLWTSFSTGYHLALRKQYLIVDLGRRFVFVLVLGNTHPLNKIPVKLLLCLGNLSLRNTF
jgi:hypothetical protein